ncbi:hypothetical protein [Bacteroides sp. 51]|uniref:hypothetical protein n=1 Tax=Bacteroides sp. 51 TaxID=2302938 RepID=UPI0013D2A225|nr:hypothetical protein [Bacteroides sp. 51]NDV81350.1 hypothetical protein [Bacteroides sp. 51]
MSKQEKPKPRKVMITFEEYQAIQLGLSEIEGSIGYGDLPESEIERYKACEKSLRTLLAKIIKV